MLPGCGRLLAASAALLLALLAQGMLLERDAQPLDSAILFLAALALWLRAFAQWRPAPEALSFWRLQPLPASLFLRDASKLLPSLAFAGVAWLLLEPRSFTRGGVVAWSASLVLLVVAVVGWPKLDATRLGRWLASVAGRGLSLRITPTQLALGPILLAATLFRVYDLPAVPSDVTSDHMEKLLDVGDVLQGQAPLFFPRNTGREPLQFYLAAPIAAVVGLQLLALQVVTITASVLAVLATYFLGREVLGTRFGLLAAGFMAVSRWEVTLARMGLRFSLTTLFTALTLLFLFRALRTGRAADYLLCGLCLGLGLLGYSTFRVVPFLVAAIVLLALVAMLRDGQARQGWRPTLQGMGLALLAAGLVVLPMARFVALEGRLFWERALSRAGVGGPPLPRDPLPLLLDNLKNALLMFNWRGDVGWVHNVGQLPALDLATGALFALGMGYLGVRLIRQREVWVAALLLALPVLLLPSALSIAFPIENPSFNRAGGAIPVVYLIVAIVPGLAWSLARSVLPGTRGALVAGAVLVGLVLVSAAQSFHVYFGDFARQYRQSVPNSTEIGRVAAGYARDLGGRDHVYILSYPHWVDHRAVGMHLGDITWNNVLMQPEQLAPHATLRGSRVYLVHPSDARGQSELRRLFPDGVLLRHTSAIPGKDFLLYLVLERGPTIGP